MANPLTVNVCFVSGDDPPRVLVQQRGRSVTLAGQSLQISAAGFVDVDDVGQAMMGTPWTAALREMQEETGLVAACHLSYASVRFVSFCRTAGTYLPGLCGVAESIVGASELKPRPTHDTYEIDGFEWWQFTPQDVLHRVNERGGWSAWVPLGAAALASALLSKYGATEVLRAWHS